MNWGTPRPPRGFSTPDNRQQPNPNDQRNTVNIPFYRDPAANYNNYGTPNHFRPRGRGGGGRGRFHDNRRFNSNNFTPRHNRPFGHNQGNQRSREAVDISQYYHPSMLEDPWKELILERAEEDGEDNVPST